MILATVVLGMSDGTEEVTTVELPDGVPAAELAKRAEHEALEEYRHCADIEWAEFVSAEDAEDDVDAYDLMNDAERLAFLKGLVDGEDEELGDE